VEARVDPRWCRRCGYTHHARTCRQAGTDPAVLRRLDLHSLRLVLAGADTLRLLASMPDLNPQAMTLFARPDLDPMRMAVAAELTRRGASLDD
jgi:hypothetical protein